MAICLYQIISYVLLNYHCLVPPFQCVGAGTTYSLALTKCEANELQLLAATQLSYNASGTTILKVLFVLLKILPEDKDGTAVAYEKSTNSSAVHPANVCDQVIRPWFKESFVRYTRFNAEQP